MKNRRAGRRRCRLGVCAGFMSSWSRNGRRRSGSILADFDTGVTTWMGMSILCHACQDSNIGVKRARIVDNLWITRGIMSKT